MITKLKRGPKVKPASQKKVAVRLWVKAKYLKLAEAHIAALEVRFSDDEDIEKELKQFNEGNKRSIPRH